MSTLSNGTPATYGNSCQECSRSKCKCILRSASEKCERCHRLGRDCHPSASKRRRDGSRPKALAGKRMEDRQARLEERLDDLVAALRSGTAADVSILASGNIQQPSPLSLYNSDSPSTARENGPAASNLWNAAEISASEAEELLETFMAHYIAWFPIIYIPPNTTAAQIFTKKPLVWLSIMAAASWSSNGKQKLLSDLMRRYIADKMVCESEKSLDLLQGLLIFIAWYHFYSFCHDGSIRTSLSLLMQMAISLVFDMNLHKPVVPHAWQNVLGNEKPHPVNFYKPQDTQEERRAVLGCWLVTSIISAYLQRMDSLRWTSHLNSCLQELEQKAECDGDLVLVYQVRAQLVFEKATLCSWYETAVEPRGGIQVPYSYYFHAFHEQLDRIKDGLPIGLQDNSPILLAYTGARLALCESTILQLNAQDHQPSQLRSKTISTTLAAIKSWFEILFGLPGSSCKGLPFSILSNIARALSTAYALSTSPNFHAESMDFGIDIIQTLDRSVEYLRQAGDERSQQSAPDEIENVFQKHSKFYQAKRAGLVAKLSGGSQEDSYEYGACSDFSGFDFGELFDVEEFMNR